MNCNAHTPALVIDDLMIPVRIDREHEYTLGTAEVALGYGVGQSNIREMKRAHGDELIEGKHFIIEVNTGVRNPDAGNSGRIHGNGTVTRWTKRGIVRLGFFIRSERAKLFRDLAEDLVIRHLEGEAATRPAFDPVADCEAKIAALPIRGKQGVAAYQGLLDTLAVLSGRPALFDAKAGKSAPLPARQADPDARDMARLVAYMVRSVGRPVSFQELCGIARHLGLFKGRLEGRAWGGGYYRPTPAARSAVGWILSRHEGIPFLLDDGTTAVFRAWGRNRQRRYHAEPAGAELSA